ncbi:hypothetical protein NSS79_07950 [Paenibacillus sp. FSL L8-0436]|uniref:hypothetical protein n=1 Tax=Paenibacillus sp. FSL L8-0436 TaxID=2954686 RepID=UPI00315913E7
MKLQRADEMEQFQNDKSARNTYIFFTLALLVWSLINMFSKGETGWEFTILLIGNVIFFWSRIFYRRKMK